MDSMDLQKLENEIIKTGFVFENKIATILKEQGWIVISNRYYIDDQEESVREIDLLAYKVSELENFQVFTALLISCKKSDSNIWALLSRELDTKNPNYNYTPFHGWSNSKPIAYQISQESWNSSYHKKMTDYGAGDVLNIPDVEIFAFQEMSKKTGSPQNDKNIFSSITSLMKAQAYEIKSLPTRQTKPSIYQFNLISVVDSELVRLLFSGESCIASPINSDNYISRYILHKNNTYARVRFLSSSHCIENLKDYSKVHTLNCKVFTEEYNDFYVNILKENQKTMLLIEEFVKKIKSELYYKIYLETKEWCDFQATNIIWSDKDNEAHITVPYTDQTIEYLNNSDTVKKCVTGAFLDIYKYHGKFKFVDDLPF